ncbi:hypothetical protein DV737_g496, partial [Chaetothyriales sp. CBS 132003]
MASLSGSFVSAFSKAVSTIKKADKQHNQAHVEVNTMRPFQIWRAVIVVSLLFAEWGLAYGLLDVMNYHVKVAMGITRQEAAWLAFAYYASYWPGTMLIGRPLVAKCGYRVAMFTGMLLVSGGMLAMSFGAAACQLAGMVGGHFVIGLGVSTLESSANPYVVNCGPRKGAALRILLGQTMAAVGTVVAPPLASRFVFSATSVQSVPAVNPKQPGTCLLAEATGASCDALGTVITFYRSLSGIVAAVAIVMAGVFFLTEWVPEISVDTSPATRHKKWKMWEHPLFSRRFLRLWFGVAANAINLGCQVTFAQFFLEHMKVNACLSEKGAANMMLLAQALFALGRLAASGLVATGLEWHLGLLKPRIILVVFLTGAVAFTLGGIRAKGTAAIGISTLVMFCESPSFPITFEMTTAQMGQWQASGETAMILSVSGGGVMPLLNGVLSDRVGVANAWALTGGSFAVVLLFPLLVNAIPSWRKA